MLYLSSIIQHAIIPWFTVLISFYPIWLPFLLFAVFIELWMNYIRLKFVTDQGGMVLEVKLPREITKSPIAMETFFTALWQKGSAAFHETYLKGKVRPYFSFEMASIGGQVHFYIWTPPKFKELIDAHLYAQFPGIEVVPVDDYMKNLRHDPVNMPMWATYFKLKRANAIPIKTYIDFGLDKADTKEEFKHDPLSATIEWLGSLQKGENAILQIVIQAHKKLGFMEGNIIHKVEDWKEESKIALKNIIKDASLKGENEVNELNLTKMQKDLITAIERSMSKFPFEACVRGIYIADKEANKIALRIPGLIGSWRQMSAADHFNELGLAFFTDFDYPWMDFRRMRRGHYEHIMLDLIKRRAFFQHPNKHWKQAPIILTTEALATLFHFPGATVTTPTLGRIDAKKSDAPPNLPV